jgi:hypothetical protein
MRNVRRAVPNNWDVSAQVASLMCILSDVSANDAHDRHLPVRNALRREITRLRARMLSEPVEEPAEVI